MAGRPIKAHDLIREHVDKIAATYEQTRRGIGAGPAHRMAVIIMMIS